MTMSTNHARRQFLPKSHPIHSAKSLGKMADSRKQRLQALARREEANSKRSRVEGILTQKMLSQFGNRVSNSPVNSLIVQTVKSELPSNVANVNAAVVSFLEEKVAAALEHACATGQLVAQPGCEGGYKARSDDSKRNSRSNSRSNSRAASPGQGGAGAVPNTELDLDALKDQMSSDWALLDAYSAFESEERERIKREKKQKQKDMMVSELAAQREEQHRRQQREREEAKKFQDEQNRKFEQWRQEDEQQKEKMKRKIAEEKEARQKVVEARMAIVERQKEAAAQEAARELQRVKREMERDREAQEAAVQREKDRLERIMQENVENRRAREEAKLRQWNEDQQMMQEYKAKLDREESLRKNAFKIREDKLKSMGHVFATGGAGARQAEIERKEKEIVEVEFRKKVQADEARERRDLEKKQQSKRLIARDNAKLLQEKAKRREAEMVEADRIFHMARAEAEKFENRERSKIERRRLANKEHQQQLVSQIAAHRATKANMNMNIIEKQLNAERIRMVEEHPELLLEVLKGSPTTQRAGRSSAKGSHRK